MTKKVPVRIAVVVDENGYWSACGFEGAPASDAMGIAIDGLPLGLVEAHAEYWVTAELEVPEARTVAGDVAEQQR